MVHQTVSHHLTDGADKTLLLHFIPNPPPFSRVIIILPCIYLHIAMSLLPALHPPPHTSLVGLQSLQLHILMS